jgi:hypothetical protein
MDQQHDNIKNLTDSAVRGDGTPLCEQLKPLVGFEERYAILHAVVEQNKLDRKDNPAIPKLDLYLQGKSLPGLGMTLAGPSAPIYKEDTPIEKSSDRGALWAPDLLLARTTFCSGEK